MKKLYIRDVPMDGISERVADGIGMCLLLFFLRNLRREFFFHLFK
jgi:hypothetical protein